MKVNVRLLETDSTLNACLCENTSSFPLAMQEQEEKFQAAIKDLQIVYGGNDNDYSVLRNKPSINGITLIGDKSSEDLNLASIYTDTTANWNSQLFLVGERGAIYVYTDHEVIYDEVGNPTFVPGIKIGDGNAYLIDAPFVSDAMSKMLLDHINNMNVHTTPGEKDFWNNKVSAFVDPDENERLILSRTHYEFNGVIIEG